MILIIRKYPKAFVLALILHVFALAVFLISFNTTAMPEMQPEVDVIQATAVNEEQVIAELNKLKAIEAKQRKDEKSRIDQLNREAERAKRERKKEQKRLAELEKQKKKEAKAKKQLEKERKQAEKATRAAAAERLRHEQEAAAAEAEGKRAQAIADKAKAEALEALKKQRKLEENRRRQEMMEADEKRAAAARNKKAQSTIRRYQALIKQKVERNWIKPTTFKKGLSCTVLVRMMPSGEVLEVKVVKSSGDPIFDRSVEQAVRKAAPLPLPSDSSLFASFRNLKFLFKPGS